MYVAERTEYMLDGGVFGLWEKNSQKVQLIDLLTDSWTDRQRIMLVFVDSLYSEQQKTENEEKKQHIIISI